MNVLIVDDEEELRAILSEPRLGGLEALKRIHKFDPRIRVVVLTASSDPVQHEAARTYGASEVHTKPYDLVHLARVIAGGGVTNVGRGLVARA